MPKFETDAEKEAWVEGRRAVAKGAPRHERPNYLTQKEREAFSAGWDYGEERIVWHRDDDRLLSVP